MTCSGCEDKLSQLLQDRGSKLWSSTFKASIEYSSAYSGTDYGWWVARVWVVRCELKLTVLMSRCVFTVLDDVVDGSNSQNETREARESPDQ